MTRSVVIVFPEWADRVVDRLAGRERIDTAGEATAMSRFEAMVRVITGVSPLVEVEGSGTVVFAARGPSRYFGGDEALARHLDDVCAVAPDGLVVPHGVGIAGSRFAATAAARLALSRNRPCVVSDELTTGFIAALPVAALGELGGIDDEVVDLLGRLGLSRCAAVRDLGERALIDRFGEQGRRVHGLVSGRDVVHLAPGPPPHDFAASVSFDVPLASVHATVGAARPTVETMMSRIAGFGQQCVRLMVTVGTDHDEHSERLWGDPRGFSAVDVCARLHAQLSGWLVDDDADPDAPTAGIVRVGFVPVECREALVVQPLLWGGQQENVERAARSVAMAVAVGGIRVGVPKWEGGRDVASVWSLADASLVDLSDVDAAERRVAEGDGAPRAWTGAIPVPAPAAIAPAPPQVRLVDVDGTDVSVTGRHDFTTAPASVEVGGACLEVLRVAGPWPVEERWWDPRRRRRQARAQVLVRNPGAGTGVLLLVAENGAWSLLARYD
ncbi:MAG: hypothetical protein ACKOQ7_03040 [Actinomycetota bacterium]